MKKRLVSFTDKVLHTKCEEVPYNDKNIAQDVLDSFVQGSMLGLSAPQIGLPYQCSVCQFSDGIEVVINPTIEYLGKEVNSTERCLSYPNFLCVVKRNDKIKLKYYNNKWQKCERVLEGLEAAIAQHEYDHLQGITMMDKAIKKSFKRG